MKNKLFIVAFLFLLIGPTIIWNFFVNQDEVATSENRTLAEKPVFSYNKVFDYPKQYEAYYNDHLPFKSRLVNLYSNFNYKIFNRVESEKVLLGKDNWLFYKSAGVEELEDEQPIADYQGTNLYTKKEKETILNDIDLVNEYLFEQDIEFGLLICPNKEHIYSEYLPEGIEKVNSKCKADELVEFLQRESEVPVFYPLGQLQEEKETQQLYYKYDTHWNELGGFIASQQILEFYKGNSAVLNEFSIEQSDVPAPTDLATMLNMNAFFCDDMNFVISDYHPEVQVEIVEQTNDDFLRVYNSNADDERTLLIIRDSYGEAMQSYLSKDFQNVIFVHRSVFNQTYLEVYNPDIVLFQVVERATNDIMDMPEMFGIQ